MPMSLLSVECLPVGLLETNCYLLYDARSREGIVVDPGGEGERILERIGALNLTIQAVWNTHAHGDHIGANRDVVQATGAPLTIHPNEADWLENPELNLSALLGQPITSPPPDALFLPGEPLKALGRTWEVIFTPGHTPGGVSLATEQIVITGDTLFAGSIGRSDLPFADTETLVQSVQRLYALPDETLVYPGHGSTTTIGREKQENPFVRPVEKG